MSNRSRDFKLINNFVSSIDDGLRQIYEARNKKLTLKLENILNIFQEEKVATTHFQSSTGIGYNDISR